MSSPIKWSLLALALYVSIAIMDLISLSVGEFWETAHAVAKSLLMPMLMVFVWLHREQTRNYPLVLLALLLSCIGDVMLLNEGSLFFILGLSSFLLAHVCYIVWFLTGERKPWRTFLRQEFPLVALIVVSGLGLVYWLWPTLDAMRLPVSVYATAIVTMTLAALSRKGQVPDRSFWLVMAGAVLFMVSDAMIAISRFGENPDGFPSAPFWIMLTYITAQGLIIYGITREHSVSRTDPNQVSDLLQ